MGIKLELQAQLIKLALKGQKNHTWDRSDRSPFYDLDHSHDSDLPEQAYP